MYLKYQINQICKIKSYVYFRPLATCDEQEREFRSLYE